jgi:hypothetical protein
MGSTRQGSVSVETKAILDGTREAGKYDPDLSLRSAKRYMGCEKRGLGDSSAGRHDYASEEFTWAAMLAARDLDLAHELKAALMAIKENLLAAGDAREANDLRKASKFAERADALFYTHIMRI